MNSRKETFWKLRLRQLLPLVGLILGACSDGGNENPPADASQISKDRELSSNGLRTSGAQTDGNPRARRAVPTLSFDGLIRKMARGENVLRWDLERQSRQIPITELEEALAKLPFGDAFKQLMIIIGERRAAEDPEHCMAWLKSLPLHNKSLGAFVGVASTLAVEHPEMIFEGIEGIENPSLKHAFGSTAVATWGHMEGSKSYELSHRLLTEHGASLFNHDSRLATFAMHKANLEDEFVETMDFLSRMKAEGILTNETRPIQTLATLWATSAPSDTAAWVMESPDHPFAAQTAEVLAHKWARSNAPSVSEWLVRLPDSPVKDRAIAGFVKQIYPDQPLVALDWVASVTDQAMREKVAKEVVAMGTVNMEAARAYAKQLGLTEGGDAP